MSLLSKLASLLATSGNNKMHLLFSALADQTLASGATHPSRRVRDILKAEWRQPARLTKR